MVGALTLGQKRCRCPFVKGRDFPHDNNKRPDPGNKPTFLLGLFPPHLAHCVTPVGFHAETLLPQWETLARSCSFRGDAHNQPFLRLCQRHVIPFTTSIPDTHSVSRAPSFPPSVCLTCKCNFASILFPRNQGKMRLPLYSVPFLANRPFLPFSKHATHQILVLPCKLVGG